VHRTGDNLGTAASHSEDKLCTSCGHLVHDAERRNTSAKPLVPGRSQVLELRPRRERRAGPPEATPTGTAPGDRAAAGDRGDRRIGTATGNRPEVTATSRTSDGPREQLLGAATRATDTGNRVRRPARSTCTAAADAIGGSGRQLRRRRERETATATGLAGRAAARTPGRADAATRPQVRWTCSGAPRSHTSRGPAPVTGCLSRARFPASDTATAPQVSWTSSRPEPHEGARRHTPTTSATSGQGRSRSIAAPTSNVVRSS
jgi:hypothetical protein